MAFEVIHRERVGRLVQGSQEWLDFRKSRCNASEAAAARGRSPFVPRNPQQLTEVRAGLRKVFVTPAMNYGHEHEPAVRKWLEDTYLELIEPEVWVADVKYSGHLPGNEMVVPLACSLDGLDTNGVLYEIKCPASPTSETVTMAQVGKIPLYYQDQLQQQLLVTGAREYCFAVRDPADGQIYTVWGKADVAHQSALVASWVDVWPFIRDGVTIKPVEGDLEFDVLAERYASVKLTADIANSELESLKAEIIKYAEAAKEKSIASQTFGITVTKAKRAGSVDYKAIPELKGVDLDLYRAPPTEYWTIKSK